MPDNFASHAKGMTGPADLHAAIVPHDVNPLADVPRALYCNTAGTVRLRDKAGTELTYNVTAGQELNFRATHVLATGTTATVYRWE